MATIHTAMTVRVEHDVDCWHATCAEMPGWYRRIARHNTEHVATLLAARFAYLERAERIDEQIDGAIAAASAPKGP